MTPRQLKAEQFGGYGPLARKTAIDNLPLFQKLPAGFLPFLLKETIALDWKFPAERDELLLQLGYLQSLSVSDREQEMSPFAQLRLSPELEAADWVNDPGRYLEMLSAHLWATSQMDTFRTASERYMKDFRTAHPDRPPPVPRFAVVLVGQGVSSNSYAMFRKLRREGSHFRQVNGADGVASTMRVLEARAAAQPAPFAHWFIDGGTTPNRIANAATVSYDELAPLRDTLTAKMRQAFESRMSSEALRSMLAEMTPASLGIDSRAGDQVLNRFKLSLFTEGSGTQIYSTTFVQWTAREVFRRAKPLTVVARYAPRQREASMNELLSGALQNGKDPEGSLVDADMGAWYTWIGLQRLTGAEQSSFVAWFENHNEAVAVGPRFPKGKEETAPIAFGELLDRAAGISKQS